MNDEQSVEAAMWLMIFVQTIGSVDMPGSGQRKLPAPRAYVPIVVGFSILQLIADMGNTRAAKAMAWVLVATAVFLGPFGQKLVSFLNSSATFAQSNSQATVGNAAASGVTQSANSLTPSVRSRNPVTSGTASAVQSTDTGIASVLKNLPF